MFNLSEKTKTLAATKLQAVWRGFLARNRDPFVMRVQYELRQRRSEQHIRYLNAEVERFEMLLNNNTSYPMSS